MVKLTLIYSMRVEIKGRAPTYSTLARNVQVKLFKFFTILYLSINEYKNTTTFYFGTTNKFYFVGKFANMQSMNNENRPYQVHGLYQTLDKILWLKR
jgi:hypothetical protein